jgi:hypothetical protein
LKRWKLYPGLNWKARMSVQAFVSDNPKKFGVAVTRARIDYPSFLLFSSPVVRSPHQLAAAPQFVWLRSFWQVSGNFNKNRCLQLQNHSSTDKIVRR